MKIRLLPDGVINRIAAGEVVERPASVVKEIVENAIDAGADKVDVKIKRGGQTLIEVTDNGCGMSCDELAIAIARHATSKLPSDEDLSNISTLGFRGEALPSIAAVSRLQMISREENSDNGWKIFVENEESNAAVPAAHGIGTTVSVQDLFFSIPARLKFLKSERTEIAHIRDILGRLSMAHPEINFILSNEVKKLFQTTIASSSDDIFLHRVASVVGKEFLRNSIKIEADRDTIKLSGYASVPTFNRSTTRDQYFFVNGRPIRDKLIYGAIRGAYADFLSRGRHPVVALFLNISPSEIDVNVHPAKTEVRFRDAGIIRGLVVASLKRGLADSGHRSSTLISTAALGAMKPESSKSTALLSALSPQSGQPFAASGSKDRDFSLKPTANTIENIPDTKEEWPLGVARGQVHGTYIVSQTEDGIIIVDQHAAHERLVYEQIKNDLQVGGVKRQILLLPEVVELDVTIAEQLLKRQAELSDFGLVIEEFGTGVVIVREIPSLLGNCDIKGLVRDLGEEFLEFGASTALRERLFEVASSMACHGSVRAGRWLNSEEMNSLLRQMEATPHSGQCNHGRPTYVELKLTDIEVLFGRK